MRYELLGVQRYALRLQWDGLPGEATAVLHMSSVVQPYGSIELYVKQGSGKAGK